MPSPLCPNCREAMSSVEHGLAGVWSCLYCEGCWLAREDIAAAVSRTESPPVRFEAHGRAGGDGEVHLCCPACGTVGFRALGFGDVDVPQCPSCEGLFFRKGMLEAIGLRASVPGADAVTVFGQHGTAILVDVGVSTVIWSFFPF